MATNLASELDGGRGLWRFEFDSMASPCLVLCETEDTALAARIGAFARAEAARIDHKFSRYRTDSVVHAIHESRGRPYEVDDETARLLDFGATLWRVSGGRFDLTSGVLRHAWRFESGVCAADPSKIPELLDRIGWHRVTWKAPYFTLPADMEIDFGGIGKEYAVDRVADWAARETDCPVLVNFGGDLRATGRAPAGGAWRVGIESVDRFGQAERRLELQTGGLATSGDARRGIVIGGKRYGHILDARTGWPVPNTPRSITVAADTCSQAGSYSTLAMLQGAGAKDFLAAEGVRYWLTQ